MGFITICFHVSNNWKPAQVLQIYAVASGRYSPSMRAGATA